MTTDKALSMLGLAARAGKVASGAFQVGKALASKQAYLILYDAQLSEAAADEYLHSPVHAVKLESGELGRAIGKPERLVCAVTETNFANRIYSLINGGA